MTRVVLMIAGVMVAALITVLVFVEPLMTIEDAGIDRFESLMEMNVEETTIMRDGVAVRTADITVYDSIWFSVKGMIRGNVQHY